MTLLKVFGSNAGQTNLNYESLGPIEKKYNTLSDTTLTYNLFIDVYNCNESSSDRTLDYCF